MKNLTDFVNRKSRLLRQYDELIASELLPVDNIDVEKVEQRRKQLQDERLILGVCGQMKAGKSTLINALVFGRPVLPSYDLVMTAKVTVLQYACDVGFEAHFYSAEEWRKVMRSIEGDEPSRKRLEDDLARAAEAGVQKAEFVRPVGRVDRVTGLEELSKYVAVASEGGCYSPYVRDVTVYHDIAKFRDLVIVDTPGINDPNVVRAEITRDWVHQATAVLYVCYAGAAMDATDVSFIDANLLHVPSSRRLIAVNKIDNCTSPSEVEAWLDDLRAHGGHQARAIFGNGTSISYVSALGGLLQSMVEANVQLSDDHEDDRRLLDPKGFLTSEHHRVDALRARLEEALLRNRGDALIEGHAGFIDSLYQRNERNLAAGRAELEERVLLLGKNEGELREEKEAIDAQMEKLSHQLEQFNIELEHALDREIRQLQEEVSKVSKRVTDSALAAIRKIDNTKNFANEVAWLVKDAFESETGGELFERITDARDKISKLLRQQVEQLEMTLGNDGAFTVGRLQTLLLLSAYPIIREVVGNLKEAMAADPVDHLVRENANFAQRLLDTKGGLSNIRSALKDKLEKAAEETFEKGMVDKLQRLIREKSQEIGQSVQHAINGALDSKRTEVERLLNGLHDAEQEGRDLKGELEKVGRMLAEVGSARAKAGNMQPAGM